MHRYLAIRQLDDSPYHRRLLAGCYDFAFDGAFGAGGDGSEVGY